MNMVEQLLRIWGDNCENMGGDFKNMGDNCENMGDNCENMGDNFENMGRQLCEYGGTVVALMERQL